MRFEPTFESLRQYSAPEWFRDAKFGIWSHWGPQSVPMFGDWYARNMYIEGTPQYEYHVRHYGHPSKFGYKDICALWKAEKFDPDALMDRYVKAGARFFVAQATHHDHFFNYNSALNRMNSVNQIVFTKAVPGNSESLTVTPNAMADFTYAEGFGPSAVKSVAVIGVDLTGDITVTAPADYEVSDEVNGTYGNTVTLTAGNRGNRETLTYDFEDGYQGWTLLKGTTGTSPNNWMHNTEYPTSYNNFSTGYGHNSSDGFMLSESYISGNSSGSGTAVTPDNYLISPQVQLGGSISFYAGARNTSYCAEKFSVMVSTTNNTSTNSFTTVATYVLSLSEVGYTSEPYTVDLSAYAGQTGYIAIRHWDCTDQWFLCIDDITIVEGEGGTNPTNTTTDLLTANVYVRLKNGLNQGSYANETLTVATSDITSNVTLNGEVFGTLANGWNWWTPTKTMTLAQLEEALGGNVILINSQNGGFTRYEEGEGWSGTLASIAPGQMYKIKTTAAVSLMTEGDYATGVSLSVLPGYTWFGYTGTQTKSIATALNGITPANGDQIIGENGTATLSLVRTPQKGGAQAALGFAARFRKPCRTADWLAGIDDTEQQEGPKS